MAALARGDRHVSKMQAVGATDGEDQPCDAVGLEGWCNFYLSCCASWGRDRISESFVSAKGGLGPSRSPSFVSKAKCQHLPGFLIFALIIFLFSLFFFFLTTMWGNLWIVYSDESRKPVFPDLQMTIWLTEEEEEKKGRCREWKTISVFPPLGMKMIEMLFFSP